MICYLNLCLVNPYPRKAGDCEGGTDLATSRVVALLSPPSLSFLSMNNAEAQDEPSFIALTNTTRPLTDSVLTVRVIKSFEFRTTKNLILHHADLTTMTVGGLKEYVLKGKLVCKSSWRGAHASALLQRSRRLRASSPSGPLC